MAVGEEPTVVAAGEGYVWVASSSGDGALARVDPEQEEVSGQPIEVGAGIGDVVVGEGSVWVANKFDDTVLEVDPDANRVARTIDVPDGVRGDLAVGEGAVWVPNDDRAVGF